MSRLLLSADLKGVGKLLDGSIQSSYWLGFLLADGSFSCKGTRIKLALGDKDQGTVKDFVEYLGKKYTTPHCGAFMSKDYVPKIAEILGYEEGKPKTYNPPTVNFEDVMDKEQLIAFYIGFIDGDGCIRRQPKRATTSITIKLHRSWCNFLQNLVDFLYDFYEAGVPPNAKINNAGYASVCIGNFNVCKGLKVFSNKLNVMRRKWDIIDEDLLLKGEEYSIFCYKVKKLNEYNVSIKDISDVLDCGYQSVVRVLAGGY